jgi:nucleoside-diphosphate-sugar epimerase
MARFWHVKRVLVTGARGFIGRAVFQPLIERGFEIVAIGSGAPANVDPATRWITSDLLAAGAAAKLIETAQPTHLLHLAWYTDHGKFWNGQQNLAWLAASAQLVGAFASAGGRRAVIAGSCAEYDWSAAAPCHEFFTPLRPHTIYGVCKKILLEVSSAHAARAGFALAWARLFLLHGPHEQPVRFVPSLIRGMLARVPTPMTSGLQHRDVLHVADVADALVSILDSAVTGPINIGSGEPVHLLDVAKHIADRLDGVELLRVGELPARTDDPIALYPDVSRLRHEIGWAPRLSLADGLDDSIAWWRSQFAARSPE